MSEKVEKSYGKNETPVEGEIVEDHGDMENKTTAREIGSTIFDVPQPKPFAKMEFKCQKTKEFLMWINGEFETNENKLKSRKLEEKVWDIYS